MKYQVIVTPGAQAGIRESFAYIYERSPLNAARWQRKRGGFTLSMCVMPGSGPLVSSPMKLKNRADQNCLVEGNFGSPTTTLDLVDVFSTSPARWQLEIRIVDMALLPEYCNAGIGSAILKDILAQGERGGKRASIHVEMFNPALALYERLGFRKLFPCAPSAQKDE